jgi:hypothetical protein
MSYVSTEISTDDFLLLSASSKYVNYLSIVKRRNSYSLHSVSYYLFGILCPSFLSLRTYTDSTFEDVHRLYKRISKYYYYVEIFYDSGRNSSDDRDRKYIEKSLYLLKQVQIMYLEFVSRTDSDLVKSLDRKYSFRYTNKVSSLFHEVNASNIDKTISKNTRYSISATNRELILLRITIAPLLFKLRKSTASTFHDYVFYLQLSEFDLTFNVRESNVDRLESYKQSKSQLQHLPKSFQRNRVIVNDPDDQLDKDITTLNKLANEEASLYTLISSLDFELEASSYTIRRRIRDYRKVKGVKVFRQFYSRVNEDTPVAYARSISSPSSNFENSMTISELYRLIMVEHEFDFCVQILRELGFISTARPLKTVVYIILGKIIATGFGNLQFTSNERHLILSSLKDKNSLLYSSVLNDANVESMDTILDQWYYTLYRVKYGPIRIVWKFENLSSKKIYDLISEEIISETTDIYSLALDKFEYTKYEEDGIVIPNSLTSLSIEDIELDEDDVTEEELEREQVYDSELRKLQMEDPNFDFDDEELEDRDDRRERLIRIAAIRKYLIRQEEQDLLENQRLLINRNVDVNIVTQQDLIRRLRILNADRYYQETYPLLEAYRNRPIDTPPPPYDLSNIEDEDVVGKIIDILNIYSDVELIRAYYPEGDWRNRPDLINIIVLDATDPNFKWRINTGDCLNDNVQNPITLETHGEIPDTPYNPKLSYGKFDRYVCFRPSELLQSFIVYENYGFRFQHPDYIPPIRNVREAILDPLYENKPMDRDISFDSIVQLNNLLTVNLHKYNGGEFLTLNNLLSEKIQDFATPLKVYSRLLEEYRNLTDEQTLEVSKYCNVLWSFAMYVREWRGPGYDWVTKYKYKNILIEDDLDFNVVGKEIRDENVEIMIRVLRYAVSQYSIETQNFMKLIPVVSYKYNNAIEVYGPFFAVVAGVNVDTNRLVNYVDHVVINKKCQGIAGNLILSSIYCAIMYIYVLRNDDLGPEFTKWTTSIISDVNRSKFDKRLNKELNRNSITTINYTRFIVNELYEQYSEEDRNNVDVTDIRQVNIFDKKNFYDNFEEGVYPIQPDFSSKIVEDSKHY